MPNYEPVVRAGQPITAWVIGYVQAGEVVGLVTNPSVLALNSGLPWPTVLSQHTPRHTESSKSIWLGVAAEDKPFYGAAPMSVWGAGGIASIRAINDVDAGTLVAPSAFGLVTPWNGVAASEILGLALTSAKAGFKIRVLLRGAG